MKVETTTFLCDAAKCAESITVHEGPDDRTAAYLALVDAGWRVKRSYVKRWEHFCTTHRAEVTS